MQQEQTSPYSFTAVDAGVDWLTCTARGKDARKLFLTEGEAILHEEAGAGVEITSARLRDYSGWRGPGVFVGGRRDDDLIVLTSNHAARLWKRIAPLATNVSRLDLQVTVWTHGEQPHLARWYSQKLKRAARGKGRPREHELRQKFPQGETLYVNKRVGDHYGRVYDYAAAHSQGEPRTLWRYEVELKRRVARSHCTALLGSDDTRAATERIVGNWFERRGVRSTWSNCEFLALQDVGDGKSKGDVLSWFQTSLRKTVARAIKENGVVAVLDALNLSRYVIEDGPRKEFIDAYHTQQALHGAAGRGTGEPVDHYNVLDQGAHGVPSFDGDGRDGWYQERNGDDDHTGLQELHLFEMARQPSPYSGNDH